MAKAKLYIVYNRATGDRAEPWVMSLGKAKALTEYLNGELGYKQYAYREVGIFDKEHPEYEGTNWLLWFIAAVMAGGIVYMLLNNGGML